MARDNRERYNALRSEPTSRRDSTVPSDAKDGDEDAASPWDIKTSGQLQHWLAKDPQAFIDYLNTIRKERDLADRCVEDWDKLVEERDKARNSEDKAIDAANAAQERYTLSRETMRDLREQVTSLQENVHRLEAVLAEESGGRQPPSRQKLSPKIKDPETFTDGTKPSWDNWSLSMIEKFEANADHFKTPAAQLAFLFSCLGGEAASHTHAKRLNRSYNTPDDVLIHLRKIYGNPDRERESRRKFNALRQKKDQKFMVFFSDFMRYAGDLAYNETSLMHELEEKVNARLRHAVATLPAEFTTLDGLQEYLHKVDNQFRSEDAREEVASRFSKAKTAAVTSTRNVTSTVPGRYVLTTGKEQTALPPAVVNGKDTRSCYTCGQKGHISTDDICPQKDRVKEKNAGFTVKELDAESFSRQMNILPRPQGPDQDEQEPESPASSDSEN